MRTKPRPARSNPTEAPESAPADALGVTSDALDAWARMLSGVAPDAAGALRAGGDHVRRVRAVGQIAASTARGLRGAFDAALDALKGKP